MDHPPPSYDHSDHEYQPSLVVEMVGFDFAYVLGVTGFAPNYPKAAEKLKDKGPEEDPVGPSMG